MWISFANKKALLDLISTKDPFRTLNIRTEKRLNKSLLSSEELLFAWREKPTEGTFLPEMILVAPGKTKEFLAWTSTYLPLLSPFTAFCHVLDSSETEEILTTQQKACFTRVESACIGVIIGETLSHFENGEIKRITPTTIMSTYSFIMGRALALKILRKDNDPISNRWQELQKLTKQTKRTLTTKDLQEIWTIIRLLDSGKINKNDKLQYPENILNIYEACLSLLDKGSIEQKILSKLFYKFPKIKDVNKKMKETREKRVSFFEEFAPSVCQSKAFERTGAAFLLGYLSSQIAPGTIEYVGLLRPYLKYYPSALAWYGLCAGLYEKTDVYNHELGLGWRIRRDLLNWEPEHYGPLNDISFEELKILINLNKGNKTFRTENHTHLIVDIIPSVPTVVIWPPLFSESQNLLFENGKRETISENPLTQLGQALNQANKYYKKLHQNSTHYYSNQTTKEKSEKKEGNQKRLFKGKN
jgi:hypothetical protein